MGDDGDDGLRQESAVVRATTLSPGVVASALADPIGDPSARAVMVGFRCIALDADAIARAIACAIDPPDGVDLNQIIVRPTAGTRG